MRLQDFLENNNIKQSRFADCIGMDSSSISKYVTGVAIPRPKVMLKIEEATCGAVTAADFISAYKDKLATPQPEEKDAQ